ncbi:MAG: hypothetical protein JWO58_2133 [Chitinophagaceae bacterium]|nr:hypothetical protein [Chitinophagaceae bacterium]
MKPFSSFKKKFPLFYLCLLLTMMTCLGTSCRCHRQPDDPSPSGSNVTGDWLISSFPDANNGFIAGSSGALAKTTDGGNNYTAITGLTTENIYACYFLSASTGFIAGDNNFFLMTQNGGTDWTSPTIHTTLPTPTNFRGLYFYNSQIGFAAAGCHSGTSSILLKTTDGGANWYLSNTGINGGAAYSIYFTDANNGYVGGNYGYVYKTTDGGANWSGQAVFQSNGILSGFAFTNANTGYITTTIGSPTSGDVTTLLTTTDAGVHWTSNTSLIPNYPYGNGIVSLSNIKFFDASNGYIVGGNIALNKGIAYTTTNGGANWNVVTTPDCGRLIGLSLNAGTPNKVYTVGLNNAKIKIQ